MTPPSDLNAAIAEAARTVHRRGTLEDTLQNIAESARKAVPGFDHAGISTVTRDRQATTRAATSDVVLDLDRLQYVEAGEGPCLETMTTGTHLLAVPQIRHEQRWPRYVPRAVQRGLRSQLAVSLVLDEDRTMGGLNLYSTTRDSIDEQAVEIAELFATHAAVALSNATAVEQLNVALGNRKVIGQAIGLIMERYDLDEDRAFAFLVRASTTSNVKLRDVAREFIAHKNRSAGGRMPNRA